MDEHILDFVAQLAEQRPFKATVAGSTPVGVIHNPRWILRRNNPTKLVIHSIGVVL